MPSPHFAVLVYLSFAAALVACGAVSNVGVGADAGDAGDGRDSGDEGAAPQGKRATNVGFVWLESARANTASKDSGQVSVVFTTLTGCPEATVEGCSLFDCRNEPLPKGTFLGAGTVVVNGTSQPQTLTPTKASYSVLHPDYRLWEGGETIHADAVGGDVPAFAITSLAPHYVTVTSPWPAPGEKLSLPRAQPFLVTWSGGVEGKVFVTFSTTVAEGEVQVRCGFPAFAGSGTISPTVLGYLPAGGESTVLFVTSETSTKVDALGWRVDLHAVAHADAQGGNASTRFIVR